VIEITVQAGLSKKKMIKEEEEEKERRKRKSRKRRRRKKKKNKEYTDSLTQEREVESSKPLKDKAETKPPS